MTGPKTKTLTPYEPDPYESLEYIYQQAIDYRLRFLSYEAIAALLRVQENTVGKWFMRGGLCHKAFLWKARERLKEFRDKAKSQDEFITGMGQDALASLNIKVLKGDMTAVMSALKLAGIGESVLHDELLKTIRDNSTERELVDLLKKEVVPDAVQSASPGDSESES